MVMTLQKPDTQAQAYDEPDRDFGYLLATASELDVPEGFNAEIFGGNIVVSPWSKWGNFKLLHALTRQLGAHAPEGHVVGAEPFKFAFPELQGALGPDVYVLDPDMVDDDATAAPSESLSLVGELTSPATRKNDLGEKLEIYGRAGVPIYLLFDMKEQVLTVFSDPSSKRGYDMQVSAEFGKPVHVPEPFGFELDTTAFKR